MRGLGKPRSYKGIVKLRVTRFSGEFFAVYRQIITRYKGDKEDKGDKGDKEDKGDKGDKGDKEEVLPIPIPYSLPPIPIAQSPIPNPQSLIPNPQSPTQR